MTEAIIRVYRGDDAPGEPLHRRTPSEYHTISEDPQRGEGTSTHLRTIDGFPDITHVRGQREGAVHLRFDTQAWIIPPGEVRIFERGEGDSRQLIEITHLPVKTISI